MDFIALKTSFRI